ncbi:MAG: hypothetical protein R3F38_18625 [Gammaproteobacteria bacterium]
MQYKEIPRSGEPAPPGRRSISKTRPDSQGGPWWMPYNFGESALYGASLHGLSGTHLQALESEEPSQAERTVASIWPRREFLTGDETLGTQLTDMSATVNMVTASVLAKSSSKLSRLKSRPKKKPAIGVSPSCGSLTNRVIFC